MRKLLHSLLILLVFATALLVGRLLFTSSYEYELESVPHTEVVSVNDAEFEDIPKEKNVSEQSTADSGIAEDTAISKEEDSVVSRKRPVERAVITEEKVHKKIIDVAHEKISVKKNAGQNEIKSKPIREPPEKKETVTPSPKKIEQCPAPSAADKKISTAKNTENRNTEKIANVNKITGNILPEYISVWIEDFEPDGHINGVKTVDNWHREGGVIFTPKTRFYIKEEKGTGKDSVLVIEAKKSSAVFACDLSGKVDLNEFPIMRWRWKVKKLPPKADGRHRHKDDQAVGIYIGAGNAFNQKAIAYRWETETPMEHWGKTLYSNVMQVWFLCQRNKTAGLDIWYEECRNVRDDFMKKYGFVPKNFALVICGNSQNSKSDALAEIDYIGFYKEVENEK